MKTLQVEVYQNQISEMIFMRLRNFYRLRFYEKKRLKVQKVEDKQVHHCLNSGLVDDSLLVGAW